MSARHRSLALFGQSTLVFVAFSALSEMSFHLFVYPPRATGVSWLPSGLTLPLFLRTEPARWPAWLLAIFLGEVASVLHHGHPLTVAVAWALANCLVPLTGAGLLRRVAGTRFELGSIRDVTLFVGLGAAAAAVPGALVAAAAAAAWLQLPFTPSAIALSWWSSDALGIINFSPLVLTLTARQPRPSGTAPEAAVLLAGLLGTGTWVFASQAPGDLVPALPYALIPFTAWAAVRFGIRGAAVATAVLDVLAIWHTMHGRGPFAITTTSEAVRLLNLQVYVAAVSVFGLMLATAVVQEHEARGKAERAERRAAFVAEATTLMSESLDYAQTLDRLARLCVRSLADWCVIDVAEGREIRRIGGAHADRSKEALLGELRRRHVPTWSAPTLPARVLRTGEPILLAEVTDEVRGALTVDREHDRLIEQLGTRTAMVLPLVVRGRTIGAISLVSATGTYGPADLALGQELARRAAIALDNARLYRDAQEAIQVRDEFLSVASHELNTPLTSLQLSVQGVESGLTGSPEMMRRSLALVGRQVRKLARLIDVLLDVSRITAGHLDLQLDGVDLAAVVRDVAERFAEDLKRAGCPLSLTAEEPVVGQWDRLRLEQVVTNLLSNAIKFGVGESIAIATSETDGTARLVIEDHGIGVPAEHLQIIFERFARGVSASAYGGLGLGLYVARSIVEAHGGSIRAESTIGKGATFTVELPSSGPSSGDGPGSET